MFPVNYFPRGQFAPRLFPPGAITVTQNDLIADNIASPIVVSPSAIGQLHSLVGNGIASIPYFSLLDPTLKQIHVLEGVGQDIIVAVDFPSILQVHRLGGIDLSLSSRVGIPEFYIGELREIVEIAVQYQSDLQLGKAAYQPYVFLGMSYQEAL